MCICRYFIECIQKVIHFFRHPTPRSGRVFVVISVTGKGTAAYVLVEELNPIEAHIYHFADKILCDIVSCMHA